MEYNNPKMKYTSLYKKIFKKKKNSRRLRTRNKVMSYLKFCKRKKSYGAEHAME